jgi:DNA polymerase-3 subunit beta
MKLTCAQSELSSALHLVSRAITGRPTHPILANVLLTADAATGTLTLTGFDLNLGIQAQIPASVDSSGATTLPARLFGEIISRLAADSPITLSERDGDQIEVTSVSGSYQIRGLAADDYPGLPLEQSGAPAVINVEVLTEALAATIFASSNDESKQILTGVNVCLNGAALTCAATDGHRLAVMTTQQGTTGKQTLAATIPAKSMKELDRMMSSCKHETISLFYDKSQVVATCGDQVLTTRILDGTYPNYAQLIPASFSKEITINRRGLINALERVAVLADQHNNVIELSADGSRGQVTVLANAQDVGSGSEALAAEIKGDDIEIAFNVRYRVDGLKSMSADDVVLYCNSPTTPAVLRAPDDDGFTYLVMPVQVRKEGK